MDSLSLREARRLALRAQGFGSPAKGGAGVAALYRQAARLGVLQIDSVNALVRSHYLPLFSRLGRYEFSDFDALAWGQGRSRQLYECWAHEASLVPAEVWTELRWRRELARQGVGIYRQLARFAVEQPQVVAQTLEAVVQRGPLGAGSLAKRADKAGPWWDWSPTKLALEWLFAAGEVTVAGRRGFERLYDLPERVLPATILAAPVPTPAAARRALLLRSARALGVATEIQLRDYFRLSPAEARQGIAELREEGSLQPIQVQGWSKLAYVADTPNPGRPVRAVALLSPFDSLVWERGRTEQLFDFRYRLELYTPAPKRVYGYYVLPFLYRERLAARVDLRAERAQSRLAVHAVHLESAGLDEEGREALAGQLRELADWLGLAEVQLHGPASVLQEALARR
ncbi:winged helix-turn-helix domain-containing protein [Pseudomonas oryzihabitans]|uniref:winged helix-turn-helix domain-containing protein n=1 Tax=Pseudomonas oryzihabitans TaxID=47885 RepID=UPI002893EB0C|nr:crosslink repair DNA glycosylase YcaQ family protein [Pseudomonas oryzihabitans]MDT3720937.1 crosslink repair DNA glycosylase YcaQ family protein [Pseudomonas oryzihabitans]